MSRDTGPYVFLQGLPDFAPAALPSWAVLQGWLPYKEQHHFRWARCSAVRSQLHKCQRCGKTCLVETDVGRCSKAPQAAMCGSRRVLMWHRNKHGQKESPT